MIAVVAAHDEQDRVGTTVSALRRLFPDADVWVADDGSTDATARIARTAGAEISRGERRSGKGGAMTRAAGAALASLAADADPIVLLCDGDLGESAARLAPLVRAVRDGHADLTVAAFSRRLGGGIGLLVAVARWAIRRRCGQVVAAPLSGQRALRASALRGLLPFADGYGMEVGMTIDAARAGLRVVEIELDLSHRATGPTPNGFVHRGRQLIDVVRASRSRR